MALGGVPIADIPMAELRRRVALVPQEVELFEGTIRDNVTLFDPAPTDAAVEEALRRVGLGALAAGGIHRPLGARRRRAVGRRVAAAGARPGVAAPARPRRARRGDGAHRPGHRAAPGGRRRRADRGPHDAHHRPQAVDAADGRRGHRVRPRPRRRARRPRGARRPGRQPLALPARAGPRAWSTCHERRRRATSSACGAWRGGSASTSRARSGSAGPRSSCSSRMPAAHRLPAGQGFDALSDGDTAAVYRWALAVAVAETVRMASIHYGAITWTQGVGAHADAAARQPADRPGGQRRAGGRPAGRLGRRGADPLPRRHRGRRHARRRDGRRVRRARVHRARRVPARRRRRRRRRSCCCCRWPASCSRPAPSTGGSRRTGPPTARRRPRSPGWSAT